MSKSKIIAGIELGSSKITTLIGQVTRDPATFETSISILGASTSNSLGIRKGQIVDIEEAVEGTIASVEGAERMAGYNLSAAYVAVGGAHIHSLNSHGVVAVSDSDEEISPADVDRVIEAASAVSLPGSREVIHVLPRDFIVDGEPGVKDPVGMTGVRLEVETHIVTAASAAVKNLTKCLGEVGIDVTELVFSGLASSESTLSSTEKELGCVVVDIGGGTTSIAVFIEGSLAYSGVVPIGGRNVTNDLAIGLRISLESAEKIKIALGKPKKDKEESDEVNLESLGLTEIKNVSRKTLVEGIVRPRLNEIFTMVRLELEKEGLLGRVPSGAVLTGGGSETAQAQDAAKRMLALPVRLGTPRGVGGLIDDITGPAFATATGLVLYGAKKEPEQTGKSLSSFTKKIKLPSMGLAGKLVDMIKDLLP